IKQLRVFTIVAIIIAMIIAGLITSLFLRMLITKDLNQIAVMKTIGFSNQAIHLQYITRMLFVLIFGIILGTLVANVLVSILIGGLLSIMGATNISFVIDPLQAYILCPLLMAAAVMAVAILNIVSIKDIGMDELKAS